MSGPARTADALAIAALARRKLEARLAFLASDPAEDTPEAEAAFTAAHPVPPASPVPGGPREGLIRVFGLDAAEAALLDLAVAVAVDPGLEPRVAAAQGQPRRPVPTEALARRLFGLPPGAIWRPTSPLARWAMLELIPDPLGAAPAFRADPRMADWYFGRAALDEGLVGLCTLPDGKTPAGLEAGADAEVVAGLLSLGAPVRVTVLGPPGSGRARYGRALLDALGRRALIVDGAGLPEAEAGDLCRRLQRFSILTGRTPFWTSEPARWPRGLEALPLQVTVAESARPALAGVTEHVLPVPPLSPAGRHALWASLAGDVPMLMAMAAATAAEIARVAPVARVDARLAERMVGQRALSALAAAGRIVHPKVSWDDMVLAGDVLDALRDYATEARLQGDLMARPEVHRLYRKDAAPTALFSGPPGVGKTMAAECVAAELGLPLLVIDVARTVSKYIGETAKNLTGVFDEARRFGCLLFFDEADAYFSKRTELKDSQDRHANADTSHLLQLVEDFEGLVILSTDRRGNIDDAFFRRIRHSIDFHRPDVPERLALWRRFAGLFLLPRALTRLAPALERCAKRFELSPAQIKAAMLTAHYRAQAAGTAVSEAHLYAGIAREMRKEGRSMPADLESLIRPGGGGEVSHVA